MMVVVAWSLTIYVKVKSCNHIVHDESVMCWNKEVDLA